MVAADAAAGDDHGLGAQLEVPDRHPTAGLAALDRARLEDRAAHADHGAVLDHQVVDPVPEREADPAVGGVLADPVLERRDDARAGPPRDVEARHRVAVAVGAAVAALGPADDREDPVPHLAQPGALLAGREVDVRLGPAPRPPVLLAVELRAAEPVLQRELARVLDAHPALLGGVDEEQPAEAPERLAAERLLGLLVQQQHPLARVGDLGRRRQAGQAGTHHDHITGIHGRDPRTSPDELPELAFTDLVAAPSSGRGAGLARCPLTCGRQRPRLQGSQAVDEGGCMAQDEEPSDPDYRFTLANERTFLAWVRTALGLLAGAVAIGQLRDPFGSLDVDLEPGPVPGRAVAGAGGRRLPALALDRPRDARPPPAPPDRPGARAGRGHGRRRGHRHDRDRPG